MNRPHIAAAAAVAYVPGQLRRRLDWVNTTTIATFHLLAVFAVVYMAAIHFSWWTLGLGVLWFALCGLSITGGYHRLFAHRSYKASWPIRLFTLAFGAASVQNSALRWASDHRRHHAHTDHDGDPYGIQHGFWWAHIGWVLTRRPPSNAKDNVADLRADPLVVLQDRHYLTLAWVFGALLPAAIGFCWGDPIGALLVVGFLRLVVQWHATFSINSLCHMLGKQTFSTTGSARDSFVTALVTMGEGYHNFHHRFQIDYRNGVRWFHYDPTKWAIWTASKIGLARELRRVADERIAAARLAVIEAQASAAPSRG